MEPYKCKELNQNGIIWLPSKWRRKFDFTPGELVDLVYKGKSIIVKRHHVNSTHNARVLSEEGSVKIPHELKNLMDLTPNDDICIFVDKENECFVIKAM